jgi:hypothetical protein
MKHHANFYPVCEIKDAAIYIFFETMVIVKRIEKIAVTIAYD